MKILDTQNFKETEIGLIPEEWEVVNLEKVTSFISRGVTPSYTEKSDVVVLNQKCVRDGRVGFEEARLTDPVAQKIPSNKYLEPFDVLINSTGQGTLGRVGQVKQLLQKTTADSHLTIVRPDHREIDPVFVGYFLRNIQPLIESFAEGSTGQTELSREKVKTILLPLPTASEQHRIASILSSLDDKIELNRQINTNLEKMASTLFKRWFVDFEFPDEEGRSYKSSGGKMVETEIGEVPEGWKIESLGNVLKLHYGEALKAEDRSEGVIKVYGSSGYVGTHNMKLVDGPGIVLGRKGNVGSVFWVDGDFYPIDTTYYVESRFPLVYCYYLLKQQSFVNGDSVVPGLNRDQAYGVEVIVPNAHVLEKFSGVCSGIRQAISCNEQEMSTVSAIRDSLLPRLMSGRIRAI